MHTPPGELAERLKSDESRTDMNLTFDQPNRISDFDSEIDHDFELARAKAICRTCGLQETCLSGAIDREETYGVWGGKFVFEGVPIEFKRKRGRPPKHPKPLLVVDEAPIPPNLVA